MDAEERRADDEKLVREWFATAVDTFRQMVSPSLVHSMDPLRTRGAVHSLLDNVTLEEFTRALDRLVAPPVNSVVVGEAEYVHAAGLLLAQMEAAHPAGADLAIRTALVIRALVDGSAQAFAPQEPEA